MEAVLGQDPDLPEAAAPRQLHRLREREGNCLRAVAVTGDANAPAPLAECFQQEGRWVGGSAITPGNGPGVDFKNYVLLEKRFQGLYRGMDITGVGFVKETSALVEFCHQVKMFGDLAAGLLRDAGLPLLIGLHKGKAVAAKVFPDGLSEGRRTLVHGEIKAILPDQMGGAD